MKIVVLGASGLVGSHVMSAGLAAGHDVVGTTRASGSPSLRCLELGDWGATLALLEAERPEVVIYAAGWTWVDGCEADPSRSRRENFEQPSAAARWCAQRGVRMLYYSSSYVFDGVTGGYAEEDPVSPVNVYGRHKADAEKAILDAAGGAALVARLICVWGREAARKNFAYQVMRAVEGAATLSLPSDQRGNPTWAGDIADWSVRLCTSASAGIWHLAGPHPDLTRPEWAKRILLGLAKGGRPTSVCFDVRTTSEIRPPAARPLRAGMDTTKVQRFHPIVCREPEDLPRDF
jgi:dTDP-4-dehydrorhamnose reductase